MRDADSLRLRSVKKDDLPRIAELEEIAFKSYGLAHSALAVIYDSCGGLWLVAEDDEDIWGYSINARGEDPHMGWILGTAIHPDRQMRGWGQLLLSATIDRLRYRDIEVIRLVVDPANKVARRLYEAFGFIDTGERIDHFGPGQPRILMSLLPGLEEEAPSEAS